MPDPFDALMQDHRDVEELFVRYRESQDSALVERICTELTVHAAAEERVIYPVLGAEMTGAKSMQQHAEKEHQSVKDAIFEIERVGYTDPAVPALMQTIILDVCEHILEEENVVLPLMRQRLNADRIAILGEQFDAAKQQLLVEANSAGALITLTIDQLYELALEKRINGRPDMTKRELVAALRGG